jgi:hypothetical protein
MTECIHYCDRCQVRIEAGRVKMTVECGSTPPSLAVDFASGRPMLELCGPCFDALTGWLAASGPEAKGEPCTH